MSSSSNSCCVCDLRHINTPAIVWCTDRDEGLCKECEEHHSLSKGTRNHYTIATAEYLNLPSDILRITQNCVKHQAKIIIYCRNTNVPAVENVLLKATKNAEILKTKMTSLKMSKTQMTSTRLRKYWLK